MFWWKLFGPRGTAFRKSEFMGSLYRALAFQSPAWVILFLLYILWA